MNIQDIIKDRDIVKLKNIGFGELEYEQWRVSHPIFSDQIETLLENGFMCSTGYKGEFFVTKMINASPQAIMKNKDFWRKLNEAINERQ